VLGEIVWFVGELIGPDALVLDTDRAIIVEYTVTIVETSNSGKLSVWP
jgi:hypothetical protein